ncbi:MAG: murein biosynthesis integral membrane protein MurJ, partial [bacterium]
MSDRNSIKRALITFSGGTFLSRITGLIRDISAAAFFTSSENDIWVVAFRIPNLLRGILAEGTTNMAVVPVLTDALKEDREKAKRVSSSIFTAFLLILLTVTLIGIIFTPQILNIMVPDFAKIPGKMHTAINLTRIMFPYILLIGLTAFCMGSLNTIGHFFASSIHPVFLNISLIFFAYISYMFEPRVSAIAYAVIIGGILQLLVHVPYLKKYDFMPHITFKFEIPELIKTWKLFMPSLLSISVVPITVMMNTYFASEVGPGTISHFFWSDRLVQFPIGIFAVSLGTAILPILSRCYNDIEKLKSNYSYAFK